MFEKPDDRSPTPDPQDAGRKCFDAFIGLEKVSDIVFMRQGSSSKVRSCSAAYYRTHRWPLGKSAAPWR